MLIKYGSKTTNIKPYNPIYSSDGASGVDLRADIAGKIVIKSKDFAVVETGLTFEIPKGFEGQVRSRSGLAARSGIFMLNGVGTIDCDFRGVVSLIVANFSFDDFIIEPGMRLAQFVVVPIVTPEYEMSANLSITARNANGLGSTGTN